MAEYQKFDWKYAVKMHSVDTANFLWNNHYKVMSESEFVEQHRALPHDHRRASSHRAPSYGKKQYRRLKERFGFFTGEVDYRKK